MPQRFAKQIVVAVIACIAMGGSVAWADRYQKPIDPYQQRMGPYQQRMDPYPQRFDPRDGGLPASVRRIQRETGGQVLRAQPIQRDGREVYRVKVLTPQGRIRVVEEIPPPPRERPQRIEPPPPNPQRNHWPE
ncbi:MAG TPA: hypothetical protein VGT79_06275 [Xanthomonadaceae bacterium]|nr:hypothetical protein [Xanthomonadaceae bacterium]